MYIIQVKYYCNSHVRRLQCIPRRHIRVSPVHHSRARSTAKQLPLKGLGDDARVAGKRQVHHSMTGIQAEQ